MALADWYTVLIVNKCWVLAYRASDDGSGGVLLLWCSEVSRLECHLPLVIQSFSFVPGIRVVQQRELVTLYCNSFIVYAPIEKDCRY